MEGNDVGKPPDHEAREVDRQFEGIGISADPPDGGSTRDIESLAALAAMLDAARETDADLATHVVANRPDAFSLGVVLRAARAAAVGAHQAKKSAMKNAAARGWVVQQWLSHDAEYRSKADFSRIMSARLKLGIPEASIPATVITAERIAREWLPRTRSA